MTKHPFPDTIVTAVANEHDIGKEPLDHDLDQVQQSIERSEWQYEYSSEHTFGWKDADAFYFYGDGIWETLNEQLTLEEDRLAPVRTVHRRYMIDSAKRRNEAQSVRNQLEEGVEALVVANTAGGDPLFGQDV